VQTGLITEYTISHLSVHKPRLLFYFQSRIAPLFDANHKVIVLFTASLGATFKVG